MGRLTYGMFMSLDGFLAGPSEHFDDQVHAFINDEMRRYGTEIYGRRMYEAMLYWETYAAQSDGSAGFEDEFARTWKGLDKLVISSTLGRVSSGNTTLVSGFRPDEIRRLKEASSLDISVAGPTLAAHFINAGLVDEYALYSVPVVMGSGDPVFKDLERRLDLDLVEERRFASGMAFLRLVPRDEREA
ncbi:MAG: deaminase [Trueperaceae bacterium]|nr:MAG: deaminase [Trueperaceae bacterium]